MSNELKKLYRSRDNRMIAGVCGGLADYFKVDPTVMRLIAVLLLVFTGGTALLAYILLWILVPEEPQA